MISYLRKRVTGDERGFTLIELLVVVIILGILTAIAVPSYLSFRGRSLDAAARSNVRAIIPDIEQYYADQNTYAGMTLTGLQATYDAAINVSTYTLSGATSSTYCIQAGTSGHEWNKQGPSAQIVAGAVC